MDNLKIKVIGVLKEREELGNVSNKKTNAGPTAGGVVRQLPKMSALDLAGILNCRRRLEWTKEWLKKNQQEFLNKENLLKDIQFRSNETYHLNCFFDITERQFRYLVSKLSPVISCYEPHRKKKSFSAEERIAITLKYLATGEVHSCRNYCFRATKPVILKMISDICLNIYDLLNDQFLALPKTDEQWQNVANELQRKDRLPNCLGNMSMHSIKFYSSARTEDSKIDFTLKPPLILTAIVDGNNNFMYVDIEKTKAIVPGEIYEQSSLRQLIESNTLTLPTYDEQQDIGNSYFFAGNGALPVKPYLLNSMHYVPTSKELSYTFSSATTNDYCYAMDVVNMHTENALCMLSNVFPILSQPLRIDEEHARKITLGCVALYNFLRNTDRNFCSRTEKMIEKFDDDVEEDDCVLIANEEERREREEFTPNVAATSCFQYLQKQKGDTAAGLAKRASLVQYIADTNLMN